jgi:cell division protein FtsW
VQQLSKYVTNFIDTVLVQIKCKKAHNTISKELNSHICELAEDYITEGLEEEEAFCKAIIQMGDPVEIGKRLHKTHKPKTEWSIIALLATIVVYGLYIMLQCSEAYIAIDPEIFYNQILFAGLGICVLVLLYFFDYTKLEKYSIPAYFITCLLHLLSIIFGSYQFGRSYIKIFGFGFTPSFMTIPILLIFYAGLVKKWCNGHIANMIKLIVVVSALPLLLILFEPSFLYFLIVCVGFLTMMTFGICGSNYKGNKRKTLLIIYGCLCALMALFFVVYYLEAGPHRIERLIMRLTIFLNPQSDPQGIGYTNLVLNNILYFAKFIGNSGGSTNIGIDGIVYPLLPGAQSELILTFVIGRVGWLFGILLIALLSSLALRLFIASSKVRNEYGKYLCVGICCVFSLQVIVSVLMNLGLYPIFGIALPFFSYGGANYLFNMALIGLLIGVYRRKDITFSKL